MVRVVPTLWTSVSRGRLKFVAGSLALLSSLLLSGYASAATAARPANAAERKAILSVLRARVTTQNPCIFRQTTIVVSTRDRRWAFVKMNDSDHPSYGKVCPKSYQGQQFSAATAFRTTTKAWRVEVFGSDVACADGGRMMPPPTVRKDIGLFCHR